MSNFALIWPTSGRERDNPKNGMIFDLNTLILPHSTDILFLKNFYLEGTYYRDWELQVS